MLHMDAVVHWCLQSQTHVAPIMDALTALPLHAMSTVQSDGAMVGSAVVDGTVVVEAVVGMVGCTVVVESSVEVVGGSVVAVGAAVDAFVGICTVVFTRGAAVDVFAKVLSGVVVVIGGALEVVGISVVVDRGCVVRAVLVAGISVVVDGAIVVLSGTSVVAAVDVLEARGLSVVAVEGGGVGGSGASVSGERDSDSD